MRRWWKIGLGVVVVGILALAAMIHRSAREPAAKWATANPLIDTASHQQMSLTSSVPDHTQSLSLPPGHLPGTNWYLPITRHSQITYVLHDGLARWIVNGHIISLTHVPVDPVGRLIYSPNGQMLAWTTPDGVHTLTSRKTPSVIFHAEAANFTAHNFLDYAISTKTSVQIHSRYPTRTIPPSSSIGHHPFVLNGTAFAFEDQGQLKLVTLTTGHPSTIAAVRSSRWPVLVDSLSYGHSLALLLRRPSALPAYLLIIKSPQGIWWYRWKTGLKPQMGLSSGQLVLSNVDPSGQLVVVSHHHLHPLKQSAGLFSQSPRGIIFQTSQGFLLLSQIKA